MKKDKIITSIYSELAPGKLSKADAKSKADAIIAKVESGEVVALDAITTLAFVAEVVKQARDGIKEMAISEAQKYDKAETIMVAGAKIELSNKSDYDFSGCNDDWSIYTAQMEQLKAKIKEREAFLKTLKGSLAVVDIETGEMKDIHPPVKLSEQIVKVTFSK